MVFVPFVLNHDIVLSLTFIHQRLTYVRHCVRRDEDVGARPPSEPGSDVEGYTEGNAVKTILRVRSCLLAATVAIPLLYFYRRDSHYLVSYYTVLVYHLYPFLDQGQQ